MEELEEPAELDDATAELLEDAGDEDEEEEEAEEKDPAACEVAALLLAVVEVDVELDV